MASSKSNFFVFTQFFLFLAFIPGFDLNRVNFPFWLSYVGIALFSCGALVLLVSFFKLGKALTPFPEPKKSSFLVKDGIYSKVRHPIYTGVLGLCFGASIYVGSLFQLGLSVILLILFYFKARYEETFLEKKYSDYNIYRSQAGMFLPRLNKLNKN